MLILVCELLEAYPNQYKWEYSLKTTFALHSIIAIKQSSLNGI